MLCAEGHVMLFRLKSCLDPPLFFSAGIFMGPTISHVGKHTSYFMAALLPARLEYDAIRSLFLLKFSTKYLAICKNEISLLS